MLKVLRWVGWLKSNSFPVERGGQQQESPRPVLQTTVFPILNAMAIEKERAGRCSGYRTWRHPDANFRTLALVYTASPHFTIIYFVEFGGKVSEREKREWCHAAPGSKSRGNISFFPFFFSSRVYLCSWRDGRKTTFSWSDEKMGRKKNTFIYIDTVYCRKEIIHHSCIRQV